MKAISINNLIEMLERTNSLTDKVIEVIKKYKYETEMAELNNTEKPNIDLGNNTDVISLHNLVTQVIYELAVFKSKQVELFRSTVKTQIVNYLSNKSELENTSDPTVTIFCNTVKKLGLIDRDYISLFLNII